MIASESVTKITTAMVEVEKEIKGMTTDAKNPFFKSNYITLDGILEFVRPILAKNNIWLLQNSSGDMEGVSVTTRLIHASGEFIETDVLKMKPVKQDPQAMGSCITYAKRYQLASLLGISSEVDDDGNKATHNSSQPTNSATTNMLISEAQAKRLCAISKGNNEGCKAILAKYGYKSSKEIKKADYEKICKEIENL